MVECKVKSGSKSAVHRLSCGYLIFLSKFDHQLQNNMNISIKTLTRKLKISNPVFHITFWILITSILTLIFGHSWGSTIHAFYFICLLLPVVMGTFYFFNYYIVPQYLLKKKYFWFGLNFYYTLVISLNLEMLVLIFSVIILSNFEFSQVSPNSRDPLLLSVILYLVVFCGSFFIMVKQLLNSRRELEALKSENQKMDKGYIELLSNRKSVRVLYDEIVYIENLADYIKLHTTDKREITSKEKISTLEEKLPGFFIRIHRSFIVNLNKVTGFSNNEVEIGAMVLPIGRSYKQQGLIKLRTE